MIKRAKHIQSLFLVKISAVCFLATFAFSGILVGLVCCSLSSCLLVSLLLVTEVDKNVIDLEV